MLWLRMHFCQYPKPKVLQKSTLKECTVFRKSEQHGMLSLIHTAQFKASNSGLIYVFRVLFVHWNNNKKTNPKVIFLRDRARNRTSNYLNAEALRLKH